MKKISSPNMDFLWPGLLLLISLVLTYLVHPYFGYMQSDILHTPFYVFIYQLLLTILVTICLCRWLADLRRPLYIACVVTASSIFSYILLPCLGRLEYSAPFLRPLGYAITQLVIAHQNLPWFLLIHWIIRTLIIFLLLILHARHRMKLLGAVFLSSSIAAFLNWSLLFI